MNPELKRLPARATMTLMLAFGYPLSADEHDHHYEQHQAHVHGEATLHVVVEGNTVEIELQSPAMNLLGFEHSPETQQQKNGINRLLIQR